MTTSNERLNASLRILRRILERGGLLTRDELLSEFADEEVRYAETQRRVHCSTSGECIIAPAGARLLNDFAVSRGIHADPLAGS
jgi:hypothetical protein